MMYSLYESHYQQLEHASAYMVESSQHQAAEGSVMYAEEDGKRSLCDPQGAQETPAYSESQSHRKEAVDTRPEDASVSVIRSALPTQD
jgi:hypothetical protein